MKDQANPVLVMIAGILMAAVTILYVIDRSVHPTRYQLSVTPGAIYHPPS
jgi:hypothetical protein